MKVKKLDEKAILPTRGTPGAAAFDLYALNGGVIYPKSRAQVPTGISVELNPGTYGKIESRSGLAAKRHIDVKAGVIDFDYRGEIIVLLQNDGIGTFEFNAGDRIAQMIVQNYISDDFEEVDELSDTKRGEGGFGSTKGFK